MRRSETSLRNILGEDFGPYTLVSRLGVGGMAETFVAIRRGPGDFTQRVCLKLVLPFFRENKDFILLFEREARLAAQLRHRNIVGVIDFGEHEGTSYMALELVDGLDLRNILDAQPDGQLPLDYVVPLAHELGEALAHAHNPPTIPGEDVAHPIIHRDISPSNVLVSREGEILLTDFGVAKAVTGGSRKQSAVKGKVPYMSPEQLRAEEFDGRADLFALGVVLFEALAGVRPYEGAHDPATIMLILNGDHPSLPELRPDAPPALCDLIERLIAPDRNQRPESAVELLEELEAFPPSPRARRGLGRHVTDLRAEADASRPDPTDRPPAKKTDVFAEASESQTGAQPVGSLPGAFDETAASEPSSPPPETPLEEFTPPSSPRGGGTQRLTPAEQGFLQRGESPGAHSEKREPPSESAPVNLVRRPRREPAAAPARSAPGLRSPERLPVRTPAVREDTPDHRPPIWKPIAMIAGALLALAVVIGVTVNFWPSDDGPSAESPAPPIIDPEPEPVPEPEPLPEPEPEPVPEPEPKPDPKPVAPQSKKPGRLSIVVMPWGNIWINGEPWGPAPLRKEPLPPGKYTVSVGRQGPTETKVVRLRPGQNRTLNFDLTD